MSKKFLKITTLAFLSVFIMSNQAVRAHTTTAVAAGCEGQCEAITNKFTSQIKDWCHTRWGQASGKSTKKERQCNNELVKNLLQVNGFKPACKKTCISIENS